MHSKFIVQITREGTVGLLQDGEPAVVEQSRNIPVPAEFAERVEKRHFPA